MRYLKKVYERNVVLCDLTEEHGEWEAMLTKDLENLVVHDSTVVIGVNPDKGFGREDLHTLQDLVVNTIPEAICNAEDGVVLFDKEFDTHGYEVDGVTDNGEYIIDIWKDENARKVITDYLIL